MSTLHDHADLGSQATSQATGQTTIESSQEAVVTTAPARKALAVLRVGFGLTFLWAFFDKLLALGFATGVDDKGIVDRFGPAAWINGGSPTEGFLKFGADGPFQGFYNSIGGTVWADSLFMFGLLGHRARAHLRFRHPDRRCRWLRALPDDVLRGPSRSEQPRHRRPHPRRHQHGGPRPHPGRRHLGRRQGLVPPAPRPALPLPAVTGDISREEDTAADSPVSSSGETTAPLPYSVSGATGPLSPDELALTDAWWRAANYLAVGQIYLRDNPLLTEPLLPEHVKPRLLGHFGTVPGLNLVHVHANRQIIARDLVRCVRRRPRSRRSRAERVRLARGHLLRALQPRPAGRRGHARRCSGSSPSPAASRATAHRRRPGSLHEGGELGYSLRPRVRRRARQPGPRRVLRRRRRRGRDRSAGDELALQHASSTRSATGRCCRSCTSTATRSPTRRCSPGSPRSSCSS